MAPGKSEPEAPLRLGLFGGTFNPVHYGHLRSAEEVCEALALTRLWFIPAGHPPHKTARDITPFEVRLEMTRLAVGDHPVMSVSDLEGRRPGRSYSIETLRQIRQEWALPGNSILSWAWTPFWKLPPGRIIRTFLP